MFDFLCGSGDYLDIQNVLDPSAVPDFSKTSCQEAELWVRGGWEREGKEANEGGRKEREMRRGEGREGREEEGMGEHIYNYVYPIYTYIYN